MYYYPLFRVRSWDNGMRCMSVYILIRMSYVSFHIEYLIVQIGGRLSVKLPGIKFCYTKCIHDDIMIWKHMLQYWSFTSVGSQSVIAELRTRKACNAEVLYQPEQDVKQTMILPVAWQASRLLWRHWNVSNTRNSSCVYKLLHKLIMECLRPYRPWEWEFIASHCAGTFVCPIEHGSRYRHRNKIWLWGGGCVSSRWWPLVWLGYLDKLCVYI